MRRRSVTSRAMVATETRRLRREVVSLTGLQTQNCHCEKYLLVGWHLCQMTPPDAILILPGLALAYAIRSGTDLAETDGCTTSTPTPRTMLATGAMSRTKSKLRLS